MERCMQEIAMQQLENTKHKKELEKAKSIYEGTVLELQKFQSKVSVDIMIPIPSNTSSLAFMEGTLIHTNELLIQLGDKYFAEMTINDAIMYCNRKCDDINAKLNDISKEERLVSARNTLMNSQIFGGKEIIENYNEDEEILWRERHAKSVEKMKAQESLERRKMDEQSAVHYFSRLEELESEELETDEF